MTESVETALASAAVVLTRHLQMTRQDLLCLTAERNSKIYQCSYGTVVVANVVFVEFWFIEEHQMNIVSCGFVYCSAFISRL